MKFPITRESLQAFDQKKEDAEQKEEFVQRMIEMCVKEICNEVVKGMTTYSREKRFIWSNLRLSNGINYEMTYRTGGGGTTQHITIEFIFPRLVEKLKETFIGCDIFVDPLKTYLIIDWS